MKEVYILTPYMSGFGGTETVISNLFKEYNKTVQNEYRLKLISIGGFSDGNWMKSINNKKVIQFSSSRRLRTVEYLVLLPILLFKLIRNNTDIDILISTNPVMWSFAYAYKKILRRDFLVVSWYHYSLSAKPIKRIFLRKADLYLAISSGIAQQFIDLGIDSAKIKIIYNPVLRRNLKISRTEQGEISNFIYVGRIMLDGQKNLRGIIDDFSHVVGKWNLFLFGEGDIVQVEEYIKNKKLGDKIQVKGFQNDVWKSLSCVDGLVLASKYEGFPMVLNEAISVGIPVISKNCETGPADIINQDNGVLVDKDSSKDFVQTIQRFVDRNITFSDVYKIKQSISRFYSDNFLIAFLDALKIRTHA